MLALEEYNKMRDEEGHTNVVRQQVKLHDEVRFVGTE